MIYKEYGDDANEDGYSYGDVLIFYEYNNGTIREGNYISGIWPDIGTMKFYSNGIVEFSENFFNINGGILDNLDISDEYDLYGSELSVYGDAYCISFGEDIDNYYGNDYVIYLASEGGATPVKSISLEKYQSYIKKLRSGNVIDIEIHEFNYEDLLEKL